MIGNGMAKVIRRKVGVWLAVRRLLAFVFLAVFAMIFIILQDFGKEFNDQYLKERGVLIPATVVEKHIETYKGNTTFIVRYSYNPFEISNSPLRTQQGEDSVSEYIYYGVNAGDTVSAIYDPEIPSYSRLGYSSDYVKNTNHLLMAHTIRFWGVLLCSLLIFCGIFFSLFATYAKYTLAQRGMPIRIKLVSDEQYRVRKGQLPTPLRRASISESMARWTAVICSS